MGTVWREDPTDILAIMRRESDSMRLPVGGLSTSDFAHYLTMAAGHDVPQTLVQEFSAETNGNPFSIAALPGADKGVAYALAAAEQARTAYAHEQEVACLRMAQELAAADNAATRADLACKLAIAEARALLLSAAQHSTTCALAALTEANTAPEVVVTFLETVARALKDGGASPLVWQPLVDRGLALNRTQRGVLWARLMLLLGRMESLSQGHSIVWLWRGYEPQAVAIARNSGAEEDYGRTLEPLDCRTRQETDAILALARTWHQPSAVLRALDVVSRDRIYRHGDLRQAVERLQEFLATSERDGAILGPAEALFQLAHCYVWLGELAIGQQTLSVGACPWQ